ncbi:MAG: hypothetical protein ACREC6_12355 [Hyphomicrobiaceae bacterium]
MWRVVIGGVAAVGIVASAWAGNCPNEMKAVDDALKTAKLDDAKKKQVGELRKKCEDSHKAAKHDDAMKACGEAKTILGVKK